MSGPGTGYRIGSSTGLCAATGRGIQAGEHFVAALVEPVGEDELVRLDFSVEAWEGGARPTAEQGRLFGSWRAVLGRAARPEQQLLDNESLLDLLESLEGQTDARRVAFRFVLALILMRKRILVCESTLPDGAMNCRRRGEQADDRAEFVIVDPGLSEQDIAEVTEMLETIMSGGQEVSGDTGLGSGAGGGGGGGGGGGA